MVSMWSDMVTVVLFVVGVLCTIVGFFLIQTINRLQKVETVSYQNREDLRVHKEHHAAQLTIATQEIRNEVSKLNLTIQNLTDKIDSITSSHG